MAGDASVLHSCNPIKSKELCSGALRHEGFSESSTQVYVLTKCVRERYKRINLILSRVPRRGFTALGHSYWMHFLLFQVAMAQCQGGSFTISLCLGSFPVGKPSGEGWTGFSPTATRLEEEEICGGQRWAQNSRRYRTYTQQRSENADKGGTDT